MTPGGYVKTPKASKIIISINFSCDQLKPDNKKKRINLWDNGEIILNQFDPKIFFAILTFPPARSNVETAKNSIFNEDFLRWNEIYLGGKIMMSNENCVTVMLWVGKTGKITFFEVFSQICIVDYICPVKNWGKNQFFTLKIESRRFSCFYNQFIHFSLITR